MLTNDHFGHFGIIEKLGYGGMATVYRATDFHSSEEVALKILHDQYSQDEAVIQRFNREADIFYQLKHPNIVPIVNHGEEDGKFYIAMKYMAGGTLYDRFKTPEAVDSEFTIHTLEQVASALDFAHAKGVIHRDLKLENILLDDDNRAYLTDFGIAFLTDATRLTTQKTIAGTPLYMSPEQALGLSVTSSTDLYSLAVMAYLMITGYHPFTGRDPYTVLNQHISQEPPLPSSVNEELPHTIDEVLMKGLEKRPQDRYESANAFAGAFAQAMRYDNRTTQVLVRLDESNPQAIKTLDEYQSTVIDSPKGQHNSTTAINPSNSNRLFVIVGGVLATVVMLLGLGLALISGGDNNDAGFSIAQTQAQREIELNMTATSFANLPPTRSNSDNDDNPRGKDDSIGLTERRVEIAISPERDSEDLDVLDSETEVILLGRTGPTDFLFVYVDTELSGYIRADSIDTDADIRELPITYSPDREISACAPKKYGFALDDAVAVYNEPSLDATILTDIELEERVKLLEASRDGDFVYVEVKGKDEPNGFVDVAELYMTVDVDCLDVIGS